MFSPCFTRIGIFFPTRMVGSVGDTAVTSEMYIKHLKLSKTGNFDELFFQSDLVVPLGQMSQHALQTHEILSLTQMYNTRLRTTPCQPSLLPI